MEDPTADEIEAALREIRDTREGNVLERALRALQRRLDVCRFGGENAAAEFARRGEEALRLQAQLSALESEAQRLAHSWRELAMRVNQPDSPTLLVDCAEELEKLIQGSR